VPLAPPVPRGPASVPPAGPQDAVPAHLPAPSQESFAVHGSPSLHGTVLDRGAYVHAPAEQLPTSRKHAPGGVVHATPAHGSPLHWRVVALHPLVHVVSEAAYTHAPEELQVPEALKAWSVVELVHELGGGKLHSLAAPAQVPSAAHTSTSVHGSPSSHPDPEGFSA
jgi:hypothetical protein